ncbi:MAG: class I tRNA ligase family protein, partial [Candidatus Omnitrophota bacterium]|nr:class I tRNA ligase family protein [Candidatus Omnitrophota bacterium]
PHCWRCKQPVIFRATPQWFLNVEHDPKHDPLRARLLNAVKQVRWTPSAGVNRMSGMLESRPDWCLSRQRYWGSPIPVFHCTRCDKPLLDPRVIEQTVEALAQRGIEAWFQAAPADLVPGLVCPCGSRELTKDPDILDVWFDSGVSHEAVLKTRQGLAWPAQLYLEGSDQHRGWFQVSLIPSVALHGVPPYEQVLTHGFVMDGEGRKMSKSLGNVVSPQDVMQRYGADILRLWVASCDYREDVRISEEILGRVAESYRKIRNTCRYLLANLYDFQPQRDRVPSIDWVELDRWASHRAGEVLQAVTRAYEAYQFHDAVRLIHQFCVFDLSAFYLDALKDRLYTEGASTGKRRCAQTALYDILGCLVRMLAPILVVTAEEIWQSMRAAGWVTEPSVHLARWPAAPEGRLDPQAEERWARVLSMREAVMKALEEQRGRGVIHSPLEAQVTLVADDQAFAQFYEASRELLAEAFVVSEVRVTREDSPLAASTQVPGLRGVIVERAPGGKCERCWKYALSVGAQAAHPSLCERCARVVEQTTCR